MPTPTCSVRNHEANCLCGSSFVPVPIEDSEVEDEDEDTTPECDVCGCSEDDCSCYTCEGCTTRVETVCECCEYCDKCCVRSGSCFTCDACENRRPIDSQCMACLECGRCCNCYSCMNCANTVESVCDNCENCDNCCNCEDTTMHCCPTEGKAYFLMKDQDSAKYAHVTANKLQHKVNPSNRYCSAEIEVASLGDTTNNSQIVDACKYWGAAIVSDGSLPDTGFEVNTSPASGDRYIEQIADICKKLNLCEAKAEDKRCGLHVHIDARDFSYWEIRRLVMLYAKMEDGLYSLVPTSRQDNTYCRRCGPEFLECLKSGPKKLKHKIATKLYGTENTKDYRTQKYVESRYSSLNLHSWFYRGSIECRLFNGTTNATKIQNWGMLWCGILDWVYKHTDRDLDRYNDKSSIDVVLDVCPTQRVRDWVKSREIIYT